MGTCSRCGSWSVAGHNHKKVTGRDPNGLFGLPLNRNQSPYNENALFGLISENFFWNNNSSVDYDCFNRNAIPASDWSTLNSTDY